MNAHIDRLEKRLSRLLSEVPSPPPADVHPKIGQRLSNARAAFAPGISPSPECCASHAAADFARRAMPKTRFCARRVPLWRLVLMDEFSATPRRLLGAFAQWAISWRTYPQRNRRWLGECALGPIG